MIGDLVISLIARTDRFSRGMNSARKGISQFTQAAYGIGSAVVTGVGVATTAISGLGLSAVKLAADAEQTEVAFSTMLGSAELAQKTIGELRKFTASTPFGEAEILGSARSLVAFGSNASEVTDELRMLGDISSGVGAPIGEIATLYGKARVQGRLFAEDINQLTGRGIPIYEALANVMGVTQDKIKGLVEQGQIGFPEMQAAFQDMTKEGGQFFNMTAAQSETFWGKWSTLKDNILASLRDIGVAIMDEFDLGAATGNITDFVKQFKTDWMPQIKSGIQEAANFGKTLIDVFNSIKKAVETVADKVLELQFKAAQAREKLGIDKNENSLLGITFEQFKSEMNERDLLKRIQAKEFGGIEKISTEEAMRRFGGGGGMKTADPKMMEVGRFLEGLKKEDEKASTQLAKDAEKLANQMRTPAEMFQDEMARLTEMFEKDLISSEVFDRASQAAVDTLPETVEKRARNEVRGLEAGSSEAFEVMRQMLGTQKKDDKQLKEAKKQTQVLEKIEKKISSGPAVAERGFY